MVQTLDAPAERAFRPEMAASVGSSSQQPGWDLDVERRMDDGRTLAHAIGWWGVGLGLAQLLAPDRFGRMLGAEHRTRLIQAYGVRQMVKGAMILSRERPALFMWMRVFDDLLDLGTLAPALRADNPKRGNVAAAIAFVAGNAVLDAACARQLGRHHVR
ncbi:MAG TPA: hypothetical protein VHG08_22630 [Longimicrobium sp.]|nr:hypothetical protein [Longimicrobium sp.]